MYRKVRYISKHITAGLTINKVYDVIDYYKDINPMYDSITLINDYDMKKTYFLLDYEMTEPFEDLTAEIRSRNIDNILE